MENMREILYELDNTTERCVLATVIQVSGSAYRKEGASMLFTESGKQIGVISAGCIEKDLSLQANSLFNGNNVNCKTVIYDMSSEDDMSWGRGAGCNGVIHILLEKVTVQMKQNFLKLSSFLKEGVPVISIRTLNNPSFMLPFFITKDGNSFGRRPQQIESILQKIQKDKQSHTFYLKSIQKHIYVQYYSPKPRLFIFGAGPDVRPFASIAYKSGFSVKIWDWRKTNLNKSHFPDAELLTNYSIKRTIHAINFSQTDSAVIMTHDFQKDKELLYLLLNEKKLGYLGVLGPRQRTRRLLDNKEIPSTVHSPVGLNIGGEGPAEIAISIVAQLIQTQRQVINKKWDIINVVKNLA